MNEIKLIDVNLLDPSPTQPRKHFDQKKIEELTDSMREHGFAFGALLVRPKPDAFRYEIVIGERRTRAAKAAGIAEITCSICELSDVRVMELQLIENLQRSDLSPIEEADGYKNMLSLRENGKPLHTIDSIAIRLSRSRDLVERKLYLCLLGEEARAAVELGNLPEFTAALIGRIPDAKARALATKKILHPEFGSLSHRDANELIEREFMRNLRKAPFDKSDLTLVPKRFGTDGVRQAGGACLDCPFRHFRTSEAGGPHKEKCLNPGCYDEKIEAEWLTWQEKQTSGNRKAVTRAEALEIYSGDYPDAPIWASGLVDLTEGPALEELRPGESSPGKWRELVKGEAEITILVARDLNYKTHELIDRRAAIEAAKANGHDVFKIDSRAPDPAKERKNRGQLGLTPPDDLRPETGKTIEQTREAWLNGFPSRDEMNRARKAEEKLKAAEEDCLRAILSDCIERVRESKIVAALGKSGKLTAPRERANTLWIFGQTGAHEGILKRYRLPVANDISRNLSRWGVPDLVALGVELIVSDGGFNFELDDADKHWLEIFGVDYDAIAKKRTAKK